MRGAPGRAISRSLGLLAIGVALMIGLAPAADAHTDFENSDPADGAVVSEPVSQVRVRFTAESSVAGDGFVVLTPTGEIISPDVSVSEDQREFTLLFDPPLTAGDVGVQWSVRAGDAHPIEGVFTFTTTAPAPPAAASRAGSVSPPEPEGLTDEPAAGIGESVEQPPAIGDVASAATAVTLDEFLSGEDDGGGMAGSVGFVGRFASQAGSLIAIGVVAFALLVSSQPESERRVFVYLVRRAAVVVVAGSLVEAVGLVLSLGGFADAMWGSAGLAIFLRAAGAVGLGAVTARITLSQSAPSSIAADERVLVGAAGAFSGAVASENAPASARGIDRRGMGPERIDATAVWFAGLLALSYAFDGHTVTEGRHLVTGLVALVHVSAGAVWLGGLVCLIMLSRTRNVTSAGSGRFIESVVRFSVVAAIALAAVGVAGLALTVTILDSISELWSTAWGRLLIAKVMVVGVAVAAGAFNHWVLVPELRSLSAHDDARQSFVRTISIEVAALTVAVLVTAAMVAAAS